MSSAPLLRLEKVLARFRSSSLSPRTRNIAFALALSAFAFGILVAWKGVDPPRLSTRPLLHNVLLVPLSVAATVWQLRTLSAAVGASLAWKPAVRVTTMGTLSGLLPVSSGTLVRGGALVYWGGSPWEVTRALLFDSLVWLSVSLLVGGACALGLGQHVLASLFGSGTLLAGTAAVLTARSAFRRARSGELILARSAGLVVEILRLSTAFSALALPLTLPQIGVLTAAGSLSGLLFVLPGGLGVQEGLTALLAKALSLSAGIAFLAAALNRVLGLSTILLWEVAHWSLTQLKGKGVVP